MTVYFSTSHGDRLQSIIENFRDTTRLPNRVDVIDGVLLEILIPYKNIKGLTLDPNTK